MTAAQVQTALAARAYLRGMLADRRDTVALVVAALAMSSVNTAWCEPHDIQRAAAKIAGGQDAPFLADVNYVLLAMADAHLCQRTPLPGYEGSLTTVWFALSWQDRASVTTQGAAAWLEANVSLAGDAKVVARP